MMLTHQKVRGVLVRGKIPISVKSGWYYTEGAQVRQSGNSVRIEWNIPSRSLSFRSEEVTTRRGVEQLEKIKALLLAENYHVETIPHPWGGVLVSYYVRDSTPA